MSDTPTREQLHEAHMVQINEEEAIIAQRNGWAIRYFANNEFMRVPPGMVGETMYANLDFWERRYEPEPIPQPIPTPVPPPPPPPIVTPPLNPPTPAPTPPTPAPIPPTPTPPPPPPVIPTPPPPPPPPPVVSGTYPSGLIPPAVASGFVRSAFDDFTSSTLSSMWSGAYNGQSNASHPGIFLASHLVLHGDSWLRLEAYPDPTNALSSYESTEAIAEAANWWCGAGVQSTKQYPVGTVFTWACKWNSYPGMTPIVLTIGDVWPPEQDFIEAAVVTVGQPVSGYNSSYLYAPGPQQVQQHVADGSVDMSQPHIWQAVWTETGTTLSIDGNQVVDVSFTEAMVSGENGLQNPMVLCLQHQTGDPDQPPVDATVTSTAPVTFFVDWVCIDTPIAA